MTHQEQKERLVDAGLLLPCGPAGLYGRSEGFERIATALDTLITRAGADQEVTVVRFPPVMARAAFERTGYLQSFPQLIGSISTFEGDDRGHVELLGLAESGGDWAGALVPTDTVLCPAACHPLYSTITGPLPADGRRWDLHGWVFRHEPSNDPARMQAFRMREFVYVGDAAGARAHRDDWATRALELMQQLGLDAVCEVANDPFFGRLGRMLASSQTDQQLKYEMLAPTSGGGASTAIASANLHEDHFGAAFDLRTPDDQVAHSACVGFGIERIVLALLWAHGLDPDDWPTGVRGPLWP